MQFVQGNEACALGAMYAGLDFYAGYPITPSRKVTTGLQQRCRITAIEFREKN